MAKMDWAVLVGKLAWHWVGAESAKVASLNQIFKEVHRPTGSVSKRSENYNHRLALAGSSLCLKQMNLGKAGRQPWRGDSDTLKKIDKLL